MRPLEIIIPVLLAVYLLWRHPRPFLIRLLPSAAFLLVLIHLIMEGYRWQMIPVYVLTAALTVSSLLKLRSTSDWKPLASYLTMILLAVSVALPILLPVPVIPAPDGPYQVGTRYYELTDPSRKELYSGKDELRRFQIQVWYPAEPSQNDERAHWMNHAAIVARALSQDELHLPPFFLDHLALVKLPAHINSKVVPVRESYPIILFSHGWNGFNAQNTGQALQLASHGFVVVTVQHPYGAVVTVFNDGTIARNNPAALPMGAPDAEYDLAADKLVNQWAGDLAYALDFLTQQNSDSSSPFFKTLDIDHVGVYGHSTGGGAAIQFCGTDPRCKAVLGQDPFMRPVSTDVLESGVTQPAFFMFSQAWADDVNSLNNRQFKPFYAASKATVGAISIDGTTHYDFSDLP
ncbi:MAG: alpha/beta hydrolase family protein, partial [Bacteroidota bacterium]